jgi:large subunit ribosomal protein L9
MKVILLKTIPQTGHKYDVINVADGFAMNSLFPKGLAEVATPKALARLEVLKKTEEVEKKVREDLLLMNFKQIDGITLEFTGKASDKGHLFAGIHKNEIIALLKEQDRLDISAEYIELDKAIKEVGEYKIPVKVQDKTAEFTLVVKAA